MSKTKDAFIRMQQQELYEQELFLKYEQELSENNIVKSTDSIFKDLILKCINDDEYETTITVSNADGDFDTDETNVLENVNIYIECSGIVHEYSVTKFYFFSVSEIVKVCKENCMRFPNEPTLYDIRDCAKEIIELMLSK